MKNRAASLRARLLNLAKKENVDFQLIIIRFLHERFLNRISKSDYRNHFILKGGAFIYALEGIKTRPTLDIDLLGQQIENDVEILFEAFRDICIVPSDDEVFFHPESIVGEVIAQQDKYNGVRIFVEAEFGTIRQRIQIDVGFGDVVIPADQMLEYPILLDDLQIPIIRAYSKETVIAEKFEAMIELSSANSRMKDFYDVFRLLSHKNFESEILEDAIVATFINRNTNYVVNHALFKEEFATNTQRQKNWNIFLKKIKGDTQLTFEEVMRLIKNRLEPYWEKLK